MSVFKTHVNLGKVELVRGDRSGISEVRLPSGELRSVDSAWLKDWPGVSRELSRADIPAGAKVVPDLERQTAAIPIPKDAPVITPDAKST